MNTSLQQTTHTFLHLPSHTPNYTQTPTRIRIQSEGMGVSIYKNYKHIARMYVNPLYYRGQHGDTFIEPTHTTYRVRFPLRYSPRFAHDSSLCQKSSVCMYLKKFLGLTAIQTHTYKSPTAHMIHIHPYTHPSHHTLCPSHTRPHTPPTHTRTHTPTHNALTTGAYNAKDHSKTDSDIVYTFQEQNDSKQKDLQFTQVKL